jgi:hypothetical protein
MNTYRFEDKTGIMNIYSPKHGVKETIFDKSDYDRIKMFNWVVIERCGSFYVTSNLGARRTGTSHGISLHRLVTSFEFDIVDHINRDPLDNRLVNLRGVTAKENALNSKRRARELPFGVTRAGKRFRVDIRDNGKTRYFGTFKKLEEADIAAKNGYISVHNTQMPKHLSI